MERSITPVSNSIFCFVDGATDGISRQYFNHGSFHSGIDNGWRNCDIFSAGFGFLE